MGALQDKAFELGKSCMLLAMEVSKKREYVVSKQVSRSGTSVGANIEEALRSISDKERYAKFKIAYKECGETKYWLRLLRETGLYEDRKLEHLCIEVDRMLNKALETVKERIDSAKKDKAAQNEGH